MQMISLTRFICLFCTIFILMGPQALADKVELPIRLRLDSQLIKRIFKKGDESILANFQDINVGQLPPLPEMPEEDEDEEEQEKNNSEQESDNTNEEKQTEEVEAKQTEEAEVKEVEAKKEKPVIELPEAIISDIMASIKPNESFLGGEDYDFTMALNDEENGYLGIQGDNLLLEGSCKIAATGIEHKFTADVSLLRMRVTQAPETNADVLKFNPTAEKFEQQGLELIFDNFKFEPAMESEEN